MGDIGRYREMWGDIGGTMSERSEKPSSLICEMYACSSTLALAEGSSTLSLTGMGTRSTSRASSWFGLG